MTNYTITDTLRVAIAFVLFAPCLLFPGYALGWGSDVLQFRTRTVAEKLLIAIPLSIALAPLLIYLTGLVSMRLMWGLFDVAIILFAVLITRDLRRRVNAPFRMGWFLAMAVVWLVIGLVSLIDFHWGDRLYTPTTSWDYCVRVAMTDAISRTGVAPANPFFFPGYTFPLRYHYFWLLPASFVDQLGGDLVTPGQATIAGTLWSGLGLMSVLVLYVWYFQDAGRPRSRRRAMAGVALLAVTGLDIIPMLFHLLVFNHIPYTVDSWNEVIAGWMSSVLWVPHHVAAVTACLTGFLVLWTGARRQTTARILSATVAGAAFACSVGLSIYICLVFAVAMLTFGAIALWKRWRDDLIAIGVSSAVAVILAFPYLSRLTTSAASQGGPFVSLTVRTFTFPENLLVAFHAPWLLVGAVNLALLPLNYGVELGLFFVVGIVQGLRLLRRERPLDRREWAEVALIGAPILVCTFLRSGVIRNNDLGWRGFLIPQFILLLWAIDYVRIAARGKILSSDSGSRQTGFRSLIALTVGLGIASTLYGLVIGRAFLPVLEAGWIRQEGAWFLTPDLNIGNRMLAQRNADEWIRTHVEHGAVMLENPVDQDVGVGLYANHQTVAYDGGCGAPFGGSAEICRKVLADVQPIFANAASRPLYLDSICKRYSIRAVLVTDTDPVWRNPRSWMWEREPEYANRYARVYGCGP